MKISEIEKHRITIIADPIDGRISDFVRTESPAGHFKIVENGEGGYMVECYGGPLSLQNKKLFVLQEVEIEDG